MLLYCVVENRVESGYMSSRIEDYALIGDCHTAALVSTAGSIDWLCLPRFDSGACFAALLGGPEQGRWMIGPAGGGSAARRRYREGTLVLETDFETNGGAVTLVDCLPLRGERADLVRMVVGRHGRVPMRMELVIRFDYGSIVPWVRREADGIRAIAGPDALRLRTSVPLRGEDFKTVADFTVSPGQSVAFDLTWSHSHEQCPPGLDVAAAVDATSRWWSEWSGRCTYAGEWREAVVRSLVTLKALTYAPTGGIVAAPTTSLPEHLGGVRNWDYRYCWLRDATFTLYALMNAGYVDEARQWRAWLLRAVAGKPSQIQIMYGLAGERRLTELELPWLPGYEGARPVRIGNRASEQRQLDVFGELFDTMHQSWRAGIGPGEEGWRLEKDLLGFLEQIWSEPDEGIWEVRGPRRHFTHSKMMAWVAVDRAIKAVERFGMDGPVDRWRALRDTIHGQICEKGYDPKRGAFVQSYGSDRLDASLLMMPLVGFLPAADPRVRGTIEAIHRELTTDGLVARYATDPEIDGLPPGEAAFLLCSFWLADALALLGRRDEARRLFEQLLSVRNDVGLLAECYDPVAKRLLGNFPQAFSHVGLINTAQNLDRPARGPAEDRPRS
jgi:GH15 family glucan-1,4-alpha-glucosidase